MPRPPSLMGNEKRDLSASLIDLPVNAGRNLREITSSREPMRAEISSTVLGVMRYLCNALCNIITFVVPK